MHNPILEPKRNQDGSIDIRHYAREAHAERRAAKDAAMRSFARATRRTLGVITAIIAFWNMPPLGASGSSKDMPYR
ncbi:MAG: hypothetical protein KF835_10560 [Xanthobacteraceae bacterium]|nr:hypothetical protein [Xanthobacteraceae bacterium]